MNNINRVLNNMALVETRARELDCTVIAVLNNVILCYRRDGSYITWKCYVQRLNLPGQFIAVFNSGDYDMTEEAGRVSLMERAGWILNDTIIVHTEYIEALDQDKSFTAKSWARELELRKEIQAEKDEWLERVKKASRCRDH